MKEILPNIFAVEVPDVIADPHLYRVNNESIMLKWTDVKHPLNPHDIVRVDRYYGDLKDYKWPEILFTTKSCTEDDASSVRNAVVDAHFDTELQEWRYGFHENNTMIYENATDALQSLLRSHGLSTDKNYLLLKKIS